MREDQGEEFRVMERQEKGEQAGALGDWDMAVRMFTYGLYTSPERVELMLGRAQAYCAVHKYEEAREDAAMASELDPSCEAAYFHESQALIEMNRLADALSTLSRGLQHSATTSLLTSLHSALTAELAFDQSAPAADQHRFEVLQKWLWEAGASFPKLKLRCYSRDYRGVHSTAFIPKGEEVLFIPKSHIITLELAIDSPLGRKISAANVNLLSPRHCYMAVFLLQEMRKKDSFWQPYISVLPQNFASFPVFYSEEEIKMMRGSALHLIVREKREGIERDYQEICDFVPEFEEEFSLRDFLKGRMLVASRVFGIDIESVKTDALVPFADMLNHHRPPQTSWTYDSVREGFTIQALEDIPRGAAILDSYGRKSNSQFLINYGFVDTDSQVNECIIHIHWRASDPLLETKLEITSGQCTFPIRLETDGNWRELMGVLRVAECEEESLLREVALVSKEPHTGNFAASHVPLISISNEMQALQSLRRISEDFLARYPTSLDQDLASVSTETVENRRNILVTLIGEKRVLHWYRNFAISCLQCLQNADSLGLNSLCAEYIAEVESFLVNS